MMMISSGQAISRGSHSTLADRARALVVILREEFGVSFVCYDATTGALVSAASLADLPPGAELSSDTVLHLAAEGRARVTPLPDRRFRLALVFAEAGRPILVATAALTALTAPAD